jgi:hypothetical protein
MGAAYLLVLRWEAAYNTRHVEKQTKRSECIRGVEATSWIGSHCTVRYND